MQIKKNEEYVVDIVDNGFEGEGIAKIDNLAIFIPDTIKGEKVKIKILKVLSSHAYAKVIGILEKSKLRKEDDCDTYSKCGGCTLRHIDYEETINMKKRSVENTFRKILGREIAIDECIKMENPYFYRNKLQYPIGIDEKGQAKMGVFAKRSHTIIETKYCKIQNELSQNIANDIYKFVNENKIEVYNEKTRKGSLRHIIIRIAVKTNEIMVVLVSNDRKIPLEEKLIKNITYKYKEITTVVKNINSKNTNVILGRENITLFGDGYIYDYLGDYKFKISPMSFYQVNPVQTEKLYKKAVEYASLTGKETIFDLYCGIGTIGIFASKNIGKLYGIESIKEAVEDAKENAKLNNIENTEFVVGEVESTLPDLIEKNKIKPDVVFIDPPRKGCEKTALDEILKSEPKKIIYISCNPATLARDLKILEEKYTISKLSICDMFGFTSHIESICLLKLR